jgi:N,N'-diacetylchitobiose non-reducing end deacetylase
MIDTILPTPDLFGATRVLCIQPHYDDNDIAAAGTIARLVAQGSEVIYLTVTNDLMGVVDGFGNDDEARAALKRDQATAGAILGISQQYWLDYPDAGDYDYFAVRRDLLKYIRQIRPDFVMTCDPWLTYEGHRDHIQTGLAASEAVMFAGLTRIASSDPAVDAAYQSHQIGGIAFYFTREPNTIVDITATWSQKEAALRCYQAQFDAAGLDELVRAFDHKSVQVAQGQAFGRGEPLKVLQTSALHCGI